jgi:hypothetical protein
MKTIKINAYDYQELNEDSKYNVKMWLDECPIKCEEEDDQGNITYKYCYFSKMDEEDLQDHCQSNKYLFDKYGKCVHQLEINEGE